MIIDTNFNARLYDLQQANIKLYFRGQSGTFAPKRIHPNTEFVLKGHL